MRRSVSSLMCRLRHCLRDRSGVSAIEFTLILPILVVLFAATLDLGEGLLVKRRVQQIAATTADIVAQESSWTNSALTTLVTGAASILEPYSGSELKVRVSVVNVSSTLTAKVAWSYGYQTDALKAGDAAPVNIPASIAESGVQLVITTAEYDMTTVFTSLLSSVTGVSSYHYFSSEIARPRVGDSVTYP